MKAELAKFFPKVNKPRGATANGSEEGAGEERQQRRNNRAHEKTRPPQR